MFDKISILNTEILSISKNDLLINMKQGVLITPNVDQIVKLQNDKEFYEVYKQAEWVVCDSNILKLSASFLGIKLKEVIPGSSFFPDFCNFHKHNIDIKIFLLGAAEGVAEKAMQIINKRIGREIIVGAHSPSFGFEKNELECESIVSKINETDANVLLVGVGAPKQEKWIYKYKSTLIKINLFMALGATIDFEAGNVKRAPVYLQKASLEWFYRLVKEPKRLWKRYLIDDIPFFYYIIKQRLGIYKNPFE